MKILKLTDLTDNKACQEQVKLFKKLFGDNLTVNSEDEAVKVALKVAHKFDFNWASSNLLGIPAWKEYEKVTQLAWKEYKKVQQPALEEYRKGLKK